MPSLFYLPKVVSLPGSKLYFYQSGTSTPQNVYTDKALSVAHSQPITADANGVFAPAYLDPTLPDYRVRLETSTGVLVYQTDDVPSNQNVQQSMRLESTSPSLFLFDSDGTSGFRKYRIRVNGDTFLVESSNEAETVFNTLFSANGNVLTLQTNARINGNAITTIKSGSFTGTLTGCSTSPTATIRYTLIGTVVVLQIPAISATSNATTMTITGLPSNIQVGTTTSSMLCRVTDNGTASSGVASIAAASGTITFGLGAGSAAFTNSGTKGVLSSVLTYSQE